MTLRDDLEKVIGAVKQADASQSDYDFANVGDKAFYLLRDHGQAMLEAIDNARRWEWVKKAPKTQLLWARGAFGFSDAAIDAAMEGER